MWRRSGGVCYVACMKSWSPFLIVGAGGFIGTAMRYALSLAAQRFSITFPHGTLWANLLGCLLLGVIMALAANLQMLSPPVRLLMATGVCGGFTTMSTFTYETMRMLQDGQWVYAAFYFLVTLLGCALMLLAGMLLVRVGARLF